MAVVRTPEQRARIAAKEAERRARIAAGTHTPRVRVPPVWVGDPRVGHPTGRKTCSKCRAEKLIADFYVRRSMRDGFMASCKACCRLVHTRWAYGIEASEVAARLESQGHACALCLAPFVPGKRQAYTVDHDHTTGAVRGLLCIRCNTALGSLGDSEGGLLRALAYVRADHSSGLEP